MKLNAQQIRSWGESIGIPMMGFLDASPLMAAYPHLKERYEQEGFPPFVHTLPEQRIAPRAYWSQTEGIIVIGVPYALINNAYRDERGRGRLAAFCRGEDYHVRLKNKMIELAEMIKAYCGELEYRCMVDNAALADRAAAWQAGLGFYGKNNLLINPEYGSVFNIGQLLIDQPIDFESVEPMASRCGDCRRCLNACPHKALGEGHQLETLRCISYLTQKKTLTEDEAQHIEKYLFGCDECQRVCPFNAHLESVEPSEEMTPELEKIVAMDEKTFQSIYGQSNIAWRGLKNMKRNAEI